MNLSDESFSSSWQNLFYLLSNHLSKIAPGPLRTNIYLMSHAHF